MNDPGEPFDRLLLTLRKPITFAGSTLTSITCREPTADQLGQLEGLGAVEASVMLAHLCSGALPGAVEQIGARDFRLINAWMSAICAVAPIPADPPDELVITLRTPRTDDEGTLFDLALREPTAGELAKVEALRGVKEITGLISQITGVKAARIAQIGIRDYRAAEAYLTAFL